MALLMLKKRIDFFKRISWYHTMIDMPGYKFIGVLFAFYFGINFVFALLYYGIGIEY